MIEQLGEFRITIAWQTEVPRLVEATLYREVNNLRINKSQVTFTIKGTLRDAGVLEERVLLILKNTLKG